jgi:hypothetical protein
MNERNAPRVYGVRIGLVAALFSIAQALLLYASAAGSFASVRAIQQGLNINIISPQPVVDVFLLAPGLIPMLVIAYSSMIAAGLITAWLAWRAGRIAAISVGRHAGGARAGMWVWLISTVVWIVASVVVVALTHMDGTISGIFSGTGKPEFMGAEIAGVVSQEVIAGLIGLGVCAFAGARGAAGAELVEPEPVPVAMAPYPFAVYPAPWGPMPPQGYQPGPPPGARPPAGLPPYPGAVYPPQQSWAPPPGVYPPPPTHYLPQHEPPAPTPQPSAPPNGPTPTPGA